MFGGPVLLIELASLILERLGEDAQPVAVGRGLKR